MAPKSRADDKGSKLKRRAYEKELHKLQVDLSHLQDWVKEKGARIIIVFEGRDAAGNGGTIKAVTEHVSPRVFRVVALPAPSDREKTQMYVQRYFQHFPAAGEIAIFDRSWYNRAGVEQVKLSHAFETLISPHIDRSLARKLHKRRLPSMTSQPKAWQGNSIMRSP
jgi:polyphosphate kinase